MPPTYRYEIAKTGRAGCQNSACKHEGIKIQKGEFRFGSLVQIRDHDSWMWKHWGCVTPAQIEKITEQIGGLDGLDLDSDLDILDGYDELPGWAQDKIKYALRNGHIEDEDWKGDPELNRPGMKGINKRSKKKKKTDDDEDDDGDTEAADTPKPKKKSSKKGVKSEDAGETSPTPVKKKTSSKKRKATKDDDLDELALDEERPKKKRAPKGAKRAEEAVKDEDIDIGELPTKPPKSTKPKKAKHSTQQDGDTENSQVTGNDAKVQKSTKSNRKIKVEAKDETLEEVPKKINKKSNKAKITVKEEDLEDEAVEANAEIEDSTAGQATKPAKSTKKTKVKNDPETAPEVVTASAGSKKRRSKSKA